MATFHLKVVTAEKIFFEDDVEQLVVRTTQGDVGILPNHIPYIAGLGIGALILFVRGERKEAAISGGFIQTDRTETTILARTCEWADEIDLHRAEDAQRRAKERLQQKLSEHEAKIADVKLKKALNRIRIAKG